MMNQNNEVRGEDEETDVTDLLDRICEGARQIRRHTAACSTLLHSISEKNNGKVDRSSPSFKWHVIFNGEKIEIETDISSLTCSAKDNLLSLMVDVHENAMVECLCQIINDSEEMLSMVRPNKNKVVVEASTESAMPAGEEDFVPESLEEEGQL